MDKKESPYRIVGKAIAENKKKGYPRTNSSAVQRALVKAGYR